jgi:hypothetical protein
MPVATGWPFGFQDELDLVAFVAGNAPSHPGLRLAFQHPFPALARPDWKVFFGGLQGFGRA